MLLTFGGLGTFTDSIEAQDRLALLVGVSDYPRPHLAPLPSSINDAQSIHDFLLANGYPRAAITLQKNPTRREFLAGFTEAIRQARDYRTSHGRKLEQFLFFFSGHGTTVADGSAGDLRDEGPDDLSDEALVVLPEAGQNPSSINELLIRDDQLYALLRQMSRQTKQIIVVLDSCHSGGMFRSAQDQPKPRFPTKSLAETSLTKYLKAVNADATGLREDSPKSRDIVRDKRALPAELNQIESNLLFLAASAAHEEASAGDPRSQFTDRLLKAFTNRRQQVLTELKAKTLTIENLDTYLTQRLKAVEQTPIVFSRGIATTTNIFGGLFPSKQSVTGEAKADDGLVLTWRLLSANDNQRPKKLSPLEVMPSGQRFVLQIEPTQARYLYVVYVDPEFSPELKLPEPETGEDDYLLPARFAVTVPRNGSLAFTGEPTTETLRIVLSKKRLGAAGVKELAASRLLLADTVEEAKKLATQGLAQARNQLGDQVVYSTQSGQQPSIVVFDIELKHN